MIEQPTLTRDPAGARLRRAYGFEEIALVPGEVTADPGEVELATEIGDHRLEIPFIAAAMDAVADADFAARMSRHGGLAFDLVDVDEGVEHVSRRLGRGAECLEEITAKVGQAPGTVTASDIADVVVPGVAVNQQGSGCPAEDTQRRLAGTVTAVAIENQLGADERPDEAATA